MQTVSQVAEVDEGSASAQGLVTGEKTAACEYELGS
jgi:hypothetical protein